MQNRHIHVHFQSSSEYSFFYRHINEFSTLKKKYKPPQKFAVVPSIVGEIK